MYKPSSYLFSYLSTYLWDLFRSEMITKVKRNINSVEVHPQLSNNRHPVDGALVGACWFTVAKKAYAVFGVFIRATGFPSVVVSHKLCQRAVWDGLRQLVTVMELTWVSRRISQLSRAYLQVVCDCWVSSHICNI